MKQQDTIEVRQKCVYGVDKIYPVNESAKTFCLLLKQKTLTDLDVCQIQKLGYNVTWTR